jgi:DNA-binding transcriptional MerR regulator
MDSKVNKFYELQKAKKKRKFVKPQILQNLELIQRLLREGNSLKQIHEFLLGENLINCHYGYFIRKFYELNEEKPEDKSLVTDNNKLASQEVPTYESELPEVKQRKEERRRPITRIDDDKPVTSITDGLSKEDLDEIRAEQKRLFDRRD